MLSGNYLVESQRLAIAPGILQDIISQCSHLKHRKVGPGLVSFRSYFSLESHCKSWNLSTDSGNWGLFNHYPLQISTYFITNRELCNDTLFNISQKSHIAHLALHWRNFAVSPVKLTSNIVYLMIRNYMKNNHSRNSGAAIYRPGRKAHHLLKSLSSQSLLYPLCS
jgi:hypothetical protein